MTEAFGPSGKLVFDRTYARSLPDGSKESWPMCVDRVVHGNFAYIHGDDESKWSKAVLSEADELRAMILDMKLLPAGRHLYQTGVKGVGIFNCWSAPNTSLVEHVSFLMTQLMLGGGVGSAYGSDVHNFPPPAQRLELHFVCSRDHPDYQSMLEAGVLSTEYSPEWQGAYQIGDSRQGWVEGLVDLVETFYRTDVVHKRRVYDVANIRPAGAVLKSFGGTASGPLPYCQMMHEVARVLNRRAESRNKLTGRDMLDVDHAIAAAIVAGGVRRSARMSIMSWTSPEIFEFIDLKKDTGAHWSSNFSIAVDNAFLDAARQEDSHARRVLDKVVEGMLRDGEPGLWHVENANAKEINRSWSPNPCSEVELEPWEPCCLGHVNLEKFLIPEGGDKWEVAADLKRAHELMTRMLIRATFAPVNFPESRAILDKNRRIGVGHTGIQNYLVRSGIRYSEAGDNPGLEVLLRACKRVVDIAAANYCFELRIPLCIKRTCLAPTGSVSKLAGTSEGLAPLFGRYFIRRIRFSKTNPDQVEQLRMFAAQGYNIVDDIYGAETAVVEFPMKDPLMDLVKDTTLVETQGEISLDSRLALQELYQRCYVDLAISNTITLDPTKTSVKEVRNAILRWMPKLKGLTLFPEVSRPLAPYERISAEQYDAMTNQGVDNGYDEECAGGACPIR